MRLDKFISQTTTLSRKEAKKAIKSKRIRVNGQTASQPDLAIADQDQVVFDNQLLRSPQPRYFMLHKPNGYICATQDPDHPTVMDLLQEPRKQDLHIAGRLDKDTTGLVLITDDGQWSHRVTAPNKQCLKRYQVTLAEPITQSAITQLQQGIILRNESKATLPAHIETIDDRHIYLSIQEGKYHQVKRMLAAVGNRVCQLHRDRIGHLHLDEHLNPGDYRPLTQQEASYFA